MIFKFFIKIIRNSVISGSLRNGLAYNRINMLLEKGQFDKAIRFAEKTFARVIASKSRRLFRFSQFWQFFLERTYYVAGRSRVIEPVFNCRAIAIPGTDYSARKTGIYEVNWTHLGMLFDGLLFDKSTKQVQLILDGLPIRCIAVRKIPLLPGYFHFYVKREVLNTFPSSSILEVRTLEDKVLLCNNGTSVQLTIPQGTGKLIERIKSGASINKKGFYAPTKEELTNRQDRYLKIYDKARIYFDEQFGSPLFLLYGTLLGFYRQGDFIPGDDDFDAGYISTKTTAREVKQETMQLVVDLVLAGFNCSFNRKGRLFRLRLADDAPDVHLDLRPVWYEDGFIWAHKQAHLPLYITDFLPPQTNELRGIKVYHPNNTEAFLQAYYGPGWRVPDPSYSNSSQWIPRFIIKKLDSICITPADYSVMHLQIEKRRTDYPNAGKLLSPSLNKLYPLEEFEKNCEW